MKLPLRDRVSSAIDWNRILLAETIDAAGFPFPRVTRQLRADPRALPPNDGSLARTAAIGTRVSTVITRLMAPYELQTG